MNDTRQNDYAGVLALLHDYCDGLWRCDVDQLRRVFSPGALYATSAPDGLLELSVDEYLPRVAARPRPSEDGTPLEYDVESIDFAGPDTAMARLRWSLFGNDYTDFLSLVRVDGKWHVQAKVFHSQPQASRAGV